jgi:hypothetical protein
MHRNGKDITDETKQKARKIQFLSSWFNTNLTLLCNEDKHNYGNPIPLGQTFEQQKLGSDEYMYICQNCGEITIGGHNSSVKLKRIG